MQAAAKLISESNSILVVSHVHPDGDAIGSALALKLGLSQLEKQVDCILIDGVPPVFSYLKQSDQILTSLPKQVYDLVIVVDVSDILRTGLELQLKEIIKAGSLLLIDHHPRGDLTRLAKVQIHRENVSSASEIVYSFLNELSVKLTPEISTGLLTGIYTDTGGFQYPNTSTETLEIAAELMRRGANLNLISQKVSRTKTLANLKLIGIALERLRITCAGRCAISIITLQDLEDANASEDDLIGIIGSLNALPSVSMCILLTQAAPGRIHGALRTSEGHSVKVSSLAKLLGGGGHPKASGFVLPGEICLEGDNWKIKVIAEPEENR